MTAAAPSLKPGRVYRTRELAMWSANALLSPPVRG